MTAYFTIDFEDFTHDLNRALKLSNEIGINIKALETRYERINNLLQRCATNESSKASFFCTGYLADLAPDLISQIAKDGHEIACHYYYHDDMDTQDVATVEKMLARAKDRLEAVSQTQVVGFRAPRFRIEKNNPEQYLVLEKLFAYDSSLNASSNSEVEAFKKRMGLTKLEIYPVFQSKVYGIRMKIGGTFIKMFPKFLADKLLEESISRDVDPIFYLHPYEFGLGNDFQLKYDQLNDLNFKRKVYWSLRQHQWLTLGNYTLEKKIESLIAKTELGGVLMNKLSA